MTMKTFTRPFDFAQGDNAKRKKVNAHGTFKNKKTQLRRRKLIVLIKQQCEE